MGTLIIISVFSRYNQSLEGRKQGIGVNCIHTVTFELKE